jgi:hypothetical protein
MPEPTTANLTRKNKRRPLRSRWTYRRHLVIPTGGSPPPDYTVIGTISPDATGQYYQNGTWASKPAYERTDGGFWLWWLSSDSAWIISSIKGSTDVPYFRRLTPNPPGNYHPLNGATGQAIIPVP